MNTVGYVETYPHPYHRVVDGVPDTSSTVEVYQLRAGEADQLIAWADEGVALVDGGVLLTDGDTILGRVALGDFVVRDGDIIGAFPADGFSPALYVPA